MAGSSRRPAVTGPDAAAAYALGSSPGESARLQRQADEFAAESAALLDRVMLRPGQAVIDLGCGPRGVLDLLAERVSPEGRVVGLDADPAHTAMAAGFAARRGLGGVEILTGDARHTRLPSGSFDLVHARVIGPGRLDSAHCRRSARFLNVESTAPRWHITDILFAATKYACPKPSADSGTGQAA
jgi:SAM-dependent methyltransferase